jgi:hypothetical protein
MIDRTHLLPVRRQCQLLKLARSTAYYHPTPVSETGLALMRRIDELHLAPSVCRRPHAARSLAARGPGHRAAACGHPDAPHGY